LSRVVAAFHHVSAVLLLDPDVASLDQDVLVLGDDRPATDLVQALAARIPACAASSPAACATAARSRP
jgi:predicted dinucleotide-binding enzyme